MRKFLLTLVLFPTLAFAQHYHGHGVYHGAYYRGPGFGWWAAPIVGGLIGYELAKQQQPVIIQQQPVIIQQQPVSPEVCTTWTEVQTADGKIYRERTCTR